MLAVCFCCAMNVLIVPVPLHAQDKIYKTDNSVVIAKVLKVGSSEIEYKKFSNLNGPTYMVSKNDVTMIFYENGEKETYSRPAEKQDAYVSMPPKPHFTGIASLDNARNLIINENFNDAISVYAQLVARDSTNFTYQEEYAYALALGGIYEAALSHLDLSRNSGNKTPDFYYFTAQVFALMGSTDLAGELWKEDAKNKPPGWISLKAADFIKAYSRTRINSNPEASREFNIRFKYANRLASQNSNLLSIALFRDIINQHPNDYIPYVGYSIPLEKLGLLELSAQSIEKAIVLIRDTAKTTEIKQILDNRLLTIHNKIALYHTANLFGLKEKKGDTMNPQMLMYVGAMLGSGYTSLNGRIGYFLSETTNGSIDAGLSSSSGSTNVNLGLSIYGRDRMFIYGCGLLCNIGTSTYLSAKITVGLSFMNKKHTGSIDIFFDGNESLSKSMPSTITLSIGRSVYFGKRK